MKGLLHNVFILSKSILSKTKLLKVSPNFNDSALMIFLMYYYFIGLFFYGFFDLTKQAFGHDYITINLIFIVLNDLFYIFLTYYFFMVLFQKKLIFSLYRLNKSEQL